MGTMTEDDANPADNEELVIVEEKPTDNDSQVNDDQDDDQDDARLGANDDDQPGDSNDAEREAIRERRRQEKQDRKKRRDEAISRDKLELNFLRQRNDDLERRLTGIENRAHQADLSNFDAHIAQAKNEAEMAERVIAKAVAAGNGEDVTQAMRYRDQALQKVQQLSFAKQNAAQQAQVQNTNRAEAIDDISMSYAKDFISENPWYDIQGGNKDSEVILAIDRGLLSEGFKTDTQEYWDELRYRAARRLPDRFKQNAGNAGQQQQQQQRQSRGGPAIGSGKEHAPTSTRTEVYISPERKQALIDAGVWDDPVLRTKYVKRYAEYDRNNRA